MPAKIIPPLADRFEQGNGHTALLQLDDPGPGAEMKPLTTPEGCHLGSNAQPAILIPVNMEGISIQ